MAGFKCPFCNEVMSLSDETLTKRTISFNYLGAGHTNMSASFIYFDMYRCPNDDCKRHAIFIKGKRGSDLEGLNKQIWPPYTCNYYPNFVPQSIQNDYQEACAVLNISPKASATLSRRCLQGMIRDFFGISKKNLHQEIEALSGKVDNAVLTALMGLKSIGNIGAHPEMDASLIIDVEPEEASQLIQFVEFLIDEWYVKREKTKGLLSNISNIKENKKELRAKQLETSKD